jgi:hypothetical protein
MAVPPGYINSTYTPWQTLPPMGVGQPGAPVQGGGGGVGPQPFFRSAMDKQVSGWGNTPESMYPSGYLGTTRTRREDRLIDNLSKRQNQRPYTRGVHRGERIPPSDYFWPPEFNPQSGLQAQAEGRRQAPVGQSNPVYSPRQWSVAETTTGIGERANALRKLGPSWR